MKIAAALRQRFSRLTLRSKTQKEKPKRTRNIGPKSAASDMQNVNGSSQYEMGHSGEEVEMSDDKENIPAYVEDSGILMALSEDGAPGARYMSLPVSAARCDACQKRELAKGIAYTRDDGLSATPQHTAPSLQSPGDEAKIPTPPPNQKQLTAQPDTSKSDLGDSLSVRKASNQTALSDTSNTTVHHDPSKRCSSFIPSVESKFHGSDINPFADLNATNRSSRISSQEERSITSKSKQRTEGSSSDYGGSTTGISSARHAGRSSESTGVRMVSGRSSRSSSSISRRILASTDPERRERKRSKALLAFNASAEILGLNTLPSLNEVQRPVTQTSANHDETEQTQAESLFHRLRNAKSTLAIKHKDGVKHTLRRMRTMANMRPDFPLGSLKGKSLDDLARLGGESIINMPTPYCPGSLRLPTCIAAPALYLQENGPSAQYLYVNPGNPSVVRTLYNHYSKQVLGTVRAKDIISKTTRSVQLPPGVLNLDGTPRKNEDCLHDVATFFRQLLSELPGGILGSPNLFRVLKQIHDHDFSPETVLRDPGRREYVWETPPSSGAQVRMITLALVALMNDMQLELASVVFGLLSLTLEESRLRQVFHCDHIHPGDRSCSQCRGYPSVDVLASAFAPMLYDTQSISDDDILRRPVNPRGEQAEAVVIMLINLWRLVVLQMRQWEVIGSV